MLNPRGLLRDFGLSDSEVDVYLALLNDAATVRDIVKMTGRSRPTIYYALQSLDRRKLLNQTGKQEEGRYSLAPITRLGRVIDDYAERLEDMRYGLEEFIRQYETRPQADRKPKVAFYEGSKAIRNVVMETLNARNGHIDSLIPSEKYFWLLGQEFTEQYVEMRRALHISSRELWGKTIAQNFNRTYYESSQIRYMPDKKKDTYDTTIIMYDQSVLYISAIAGGYCLEVDSAEHSKMMHALYDTLWEGSMVA